MYDDYEEMDKAWRKCEKIHKCLCRIAVCAALAILLFVILSYAAKHIGAGRYDAWQEAIRNCRRTGGE